LSAHRTASGAVVLRCTYCGVEALPLVPYGRDPEEWDGWVEAPLGWTSTDVWGDLRHACSECSVLVDPLNPPRRRAE